MPCKKIRNGFICFNKIDFTCPHCGLEYYDSEDKYVNRCNKNKSGYTTIKCTCKQRFGMTYNYMGSAVSFSL